MIYCLDKKSGKIMWEKQGFRGIPRAARHTKATYCNSTPATDGQYLVTFLGSEGLFCFDMNGEPLWRKDFGKLEVGPSGMKDLQWGFASSPTIHDGKVIVEVDTQNDDFQASFDLKTGTKIWDKQRRDDSTWGSPTIYFDGASPRVAVNGY
jgi:outer membrane protein assembly factor BamB